MPWSRMLWATSPQQACAGARLDVIGMHLVAGAREQIQCSSVSIGSRGEPPVPLDDDDPCLEIGHAWIGENGPFAAFDVHLEKVGVVLEGEQIDHDHLDSRLALVGSSR